MKIHPSQLDRPLFEGEKWEDHLVTEIFKWKPEKGDYVVFRNLKLHEIEPLNRTIVGLRREGKLPEGVEFLLLEGEIDIEVVPKIAQAQVAIKALPSKDLGYGSVVVVSGIAPTWAPYLYRAFRETGLMLPGTALCCLPDAATKLEAMPKAKLVEMLKLLTGQP